MKKRSDFEKATGESIVAGGSGTVADLAEKARPGVFRPRRLTLLVALCFGAGIPLAQADSVLWGGGVSQDWSVDGNWVWDGHAPTAADTAVINSASGNSPEVGSAQTASAGVLVVGGGANGYLSVLGSLNANNALLGNDTGTPATLGRVDVNGATASLSNSGNLYVGNYSSGLLNVQGGATVDATDIYVGAESGSHGEIVLGDSDSSLAASGLLSVGHGGTGSLTAGAGTSVDSQGGVIGNLAGASGSVDIDGGSWTNGTGNLTVGLSGSGSLTVENGGSVTNAVGVIGAAAGSVGNTVTVTGSGSIWTNSGDLYVANYGGGALTIQAGATVGAATVYVGAESGSHGEIVLGDSDSSLAASGLLSVGHGGTGSLTAGAGTSVDSQGGVIGNLAGASGSVDVDGGSWTNGTGNLTVGLSGSGSLTIENGGSVTNAVGIIGATAGSIGNTVTVTGSDSSWTNSGDLYVANYGGGALNIEGGATVAATDVYVGAGNASNGEIALGDSGSSLAAGGLLIVGHEGTGSLTAGAGTSVDSQGGVIGNLAGASGSVDIDGGSWTNGTGNLTVGLSGSGSLTVENGGSVANAVGVIGSAAGSVGNTVTVTGSGSRWTNSDRLFVGTYGSGQLTILAGAEVASAGGVVSRYAGSQGSVTVSGTGSSWTNSGDLRVGGDTTDGSAPGGNGTLTISAGGAVSSQAGYIGDSLNASGTVTVDNGRWTLSDRLGVGNYGVGSLTVENGGTVSSSGGLIGWNAESSGNSVTVTGAGSAWTMSGNLFVGNLGQGSMTVAGGATVSNNDGYVGSESNALQSLVTVTGAGSTWSNNGTVFVAHNDGSNGKLVIADGAAVTASEQGIVGDLAGATGSATVTGAGSSWSVVGDLNVGRLGSGSLTILDGAKVSSGRSFIGNEVGSSGDVVISGPGSAWTTTGVFRVGSEGSGSLSLSDGGTLNAGSLYVGYAAGSTGVLNIGAAEGQAAAAAGYINAGTLTLGGGDATLVLNHTDSDYTLNSAILGSGTLKVLSGDTTLTADNGFTGSTEIAAGAKLTLGSAASLGSSVAIADGATLAVGSNAIGGDLVNDGLLDVTRVDTVYPRLTVAGDFVQDNSGLTRIAAYSTASGQYSRISVGGTATLAGVLDVDVTSGSPLALGNTLVHVIDATGGISGSFSSVTDNSALFNFWAIYGGNTVDLKLVPVSSTGVTDAVLGTGNTTGLAAAGIIDAAIAGDPTGALANPFIPLTGNRQISDAVSQTLPLLTGSSPQATLGTLASLNQIIQTRIGERRGLSSGDKFYGDGHFWVKPFASRAEQATVDNVAGYRAAVVGLAFGADTQLSGGSLLGLAFSYANANVDSYSTVAPNSAKVDLYRLMGYGSRALDAATALNWQVDVGTNQNRGLRQIGFAGVSANSGYETLSAHAGLRLQRRYALAAETTLLPSLGLDYTWVRDAAYSETGAGALNLDVRAESIEQTLLSADLAASHKLEGGLSILGNLGVAYDFNADQASLVASYAGAPGASFVTYGVSPSAWILRGGVGVSKVVATGTEILARVDTELREKFTNYGASVNVRWAF